VGTPDLTRAVDDPGGAVIRPHSRVGDPDVAVIDVTREVGDPSGEVH
jgi:hypothetical protein